MTEDISIMVSQFVQKGEIDVQGLGKIINTAVELGKLVAIRDHDNVALASTKV
jgi:hypothetical protein